jgi:ribulose-5-phosphate 4-epimerase/fuculose-1-phosphate aldolase
LQESEATSPVEGPAALASPSEPESVETPSEEPAAEPAAEPAPEPVPEPPSEPPVTETAEPVPAESESTQPVADSPTADVLAEKEAELERLHMENARLRQSMAGATEVIEQLEEPAMPPHVDENIVIPSHVVSDFVRIGRQLDREHLVRATMGSVAMIHPEQPNLMISSRNMVTLPRMNERSLCAAPLGSMSPRGAPGDWHVMEVVLASVSVVTGGPAAVIHMHGPHTTAASCEQDLVLLTPLDAVGKQHIGKIIIVDPDPDHPEEFLRQVAEALQQGGMRCVVVRGNGAYAVGADFDQAWANAAMLEHSMHIHLLARQANLKI